MEEFLRISCSLQFFLKALFRVMNYIAKARNASGCGPLLGGNAEHLASLRQQVFEYVRSTGRAARAEITRELHISGASTTNLTSDLIGSGFLREVNEPDREQGRGRPRVGLEIVPESSFVIGIKLSFKQHTAVLSDFAGNVLTTVHTASNGKRRDANKLLDEILELCRLVIDEAGMDDSDIGAVGVGIPGIVNLKDRKISWCSLLLDTNVDLIPAFEQKFPARLFLENDTNMLTLAELWFGEGRDKTDFTVVTIENGVGMGVVINNRLYTGTHGVGLELGHTKVQLDGALCRCGQRGCLEAYLGDYALAREAITALDHNETNQKTTDQLLDILFEKARSGHMGAEMIFQRASRFLAVGLSNAIQLFDPPLIIISGDRMRFDYFHASEVMEETQRLTLSKSRERCRIEAHVWDNEFWARGATVPALTALTDTLVGGRKAT